MAKKKKGKRRRRYSKKKKGGSKKKATPIAATAGTAYTVIKAETTPLTSGNLFTYQLNALRGIIDPAYADFTSKVADETWFYYKKHGMPMLAGVLLSHGDALPLVGKPFKKVIQNPANKVLRRIAGKGWRL